MHLKTEARVGLGRIVRATVASVIAIVALAFPNAAHAQTVCDADVDRDGVVAAADLSELLAKWGPCQGCSADINRDGAVNGADLASLLVFWGGTCQRTPVITSVVPSSGPRWGGTQVVITGTNLGSVSSVEIGARAAAVIAASDTSLTVVTASGSAGVGAVSVTSPTGSASLPGAFTFTDTEAPTWATVLQEKPDPEIVPDATVRAAIEATGLPWRVLATGSTFQGQPIELILVPAGAFQMGGAQPAVGTACPNDATPHPVELRAFYIGRTEVTQAQWKSWMQGANPSVFQGSGYPNADNRPVENVTRAAIDGFVAAAGVRLPTEAEWEFAYRAGAATAYHNGSNIPSTVDAWLAANSNAQTQPVGLKQTNAIGLSDMAGNVAELVADKYAADYYLNSPVFDPRGPVSGPSVVRGGSWMTDGGSLPGRIEMSAYGRSQRPTSAAGSSVGFRVARDASMQPVTLGIAPNIGLVSGGQQVTITGRSLDKVTAVRFSGASTPSGNATIVSKSDTQLVLLTPPAPAGLCTLISLDWQSVEPAQSGTVSMANAFTYSPLAPVLTSVSPSTGPVAGGTAITITGVNLAGATGVTIGGNAASSVTVVNATTITAVTPAGLAGAKSIVVTTASGSAALSNAFTYFVPAPVIASVSPSAGPSIGSTSITISGQNLLGTTSVTVGGVAASGVTVVNANTVTAVTPPGTAGAKTVSVTATGGVATLPNGFTYLALGPVVGSVTPNAGAPAGGTAITIKGQNFTGATAVFIGGNLATNLSVVDATTITALTPAGTEGTKDVLVVTAGGSGSLPGGFIYTTAIVPSWATLIEALPDPAVVTKPELRNAIIATGYAWRVRHSASQIEMLLLPPGLFNMGCGSVVPPCQFEDQNQHAVLLTNAFYMGRYEVTQAQWASVTGGNPSAFNSDNTGQDTSSRPVDSIAWNDAQSFASTNGLRLPTEAEWEYAYRAGTTAAWHASPEYPFGIDDPAQVARIAWFAGNNGAPNTPSYGTKAVGLKSANGFGLHDMAGNVSEWVNDFYDALYYASSPYTNPQGPASNQLNFHVHRGASFAESASAVSAARRFYGAASAGANDRGLRVAKTAPLPPKVASVNPATGGVSGGTTITISGDWFFGGPGTTVAGDWLPQSVTTVKIGGVSATNVTVINSKTLRLTTPPGTVGTADVEVTTPNGSATLAGGFIYSNPTEWYTVVEQNPDPAVVTDPALRAAIVATGLPWRVIDNATQVEMLLVPPGSFNMGCSPSALFNCQSDESPAHAVTVTDAFYLGRYELMQSQWQARMGTNPSYRIHPFGPVGMVSWNAFQNYLAATGTRLPSEAEWEYAYRAGTTTAFHSMPGLPSGTNDDNQVGNIAWWGAFSGAGNGGTPNSGTKPVGQKAANALGLHDMAGNAWEWVNDWYGSTYYASSPSADPAGPKTGTNRVMRGGSYLEASSSLRSSDRFPIAVPANAYGDAGFRIARSAARPAPTVSSISPNTAPTQGGTSVTITGANLASTTSVIIGGTSVTDFTVVGNTSVTVVTPALPVGAKDVILTTRDGAAVVPNGITYVIPAPIVASVSPSTGPTTGGTRITITGDNLLNTSAVLIGGVPATAISVVNATTVLATTPSGTVGAKALALTTPAGTATLPNAFTYAAPDVPSWAQVIEYSPNPTVVTSATLRNAIVATGLPWRVRDTATQVEMLLVPPGTFDMGCSPSNQSACFDMESPVHAVTLTQPFYIARYELTNDQWNARMGSNPTGASGSTPVEMVSWNNTQRFLAATGLRLPTEAEWEYAYRAGTTTAYHAMPGFANGTSDEAQAQAIAWLYTGDCNSGAFCQEQPVGQKAANGFGLHDMSGNVAEWVSDWFGDYTPAAVSDPVGASTGSDRVMRGGGYYNRALGARASYRSYGPEGTNFGAVGFRVARSVAPSLPTITAVTPNSGPLTGGTTITITGTNLLGTTSVSVGGVSALNMTVVDANTITAVTPPNSAGAKDVVVAKASGAASRANAFSYVAPAPTIASVSPASGPVAGGTLVTITGTSLLSTTSVTIGGAPATGVYASDDSTLYAYTPAGTAGAQDVVVTTAFGSATRAGGFTYRVTTPTITSITPATGSIYGGTVVTIIGQNLEGTTAVTIGGNAAWNVTVVNATTVTATTPAGDAGSATVALTTPFGTATLANAFIYWTPGGSWTVIEESPDPAVVPSQAMRDAIIATGLPWRVVDTATQIEMLLIPGGTFEMGCSSPVSGGDCPKDALPAHTVELRPFYLGRREVSQAEWNQQVYFNPSLNQNPAAPVENVQTSWVDSFLTNTGMRLPTEAEWEFAYRAGTTTAFYTGSNDPAGLDEWSVVNSGGQSHPVGTTTPNGFGLSDMAGNVSEFVSDRYATDYYANSPVFNPTGPADPAEGPRAVRGGSWASPQSELTAYIRGSLDLFAASGQTGFRVVRDAPVVLQVSTLAPSEGPTTGGQEVTITGRGLDGVTSVRFECSKSSSETAGIISWTYSELKVLTPPGQPGVCGRIVIEWQYPDGTPGLPIVLTDMYTYRNFVTPAWATLLEPMPDPAVVTDPAMRDAILATGLAWRVVDTATQVEMVLIPPGSFQMGCSPFADSWCSAAAESPVHDVTLTNAFYVARHELTQAQWTATMGYNPSAFQSAPDSASRPVENVSWDDAQGFLTATGFRLLTEAEWEYAYRAGTTTALHSMPGFPQGTNDPAQAGVIAWYLSNATETHTVGEKAANGFGLHDMSGNVWEFVNDRWSETYYKTSPIENPQGPATGDDRVMRGGSWADDEEYYLRSSARRWYPSYGAAYYIGFRVARNP